MTPLGDSECQTFPRWTFTDPDWVGYLLAVWTPCDEYYDEQEYWGDLIAYHRGLGSYTPEIPAQFLENTVGYRDPRMWCACAVPAGVMT